MDDRFAGLGPAEIAHVVLTESVGGPRYIVIPASITGHCCFGWSILDRTAATDFYDVPMPLCECLEEADANRIAAALNTGGGE